jgi:O-acetyl-ADP-ribose deacetylase (regulator of RNase III)
VPIGSVAARPSFDASTAANAKVGLYHGDITRLEIDGIVNAANRSLLGGGGIDGAIHRAAGEKLYCECALLDGANTGECKVTRGYDLPAAHVLHCVGPIGEHPDKLKACYVNALNAVKNSNGDIRTVAFCGISTGIYGYPLEAAAHVALRTTREWLDDADNAASVDLLVFVTFLAKEQSTYRELMLKYFPVEWTTAENRRRGRGEADESGRRQLIEYCTQSSQRFRLMRIRTRHSSLLDISTLVCHRPVALVQTVADVVVVVWAREQRLVVLECKSGTAAKRREPTHARRRCTR